MTKVVGVRFRNVGKIYYFSAGSVCDCHGTLCNRADRDSGVGLCKRYLRKWERQGEYYV